VALEWPYMPSMQIKNVPPDVHDTLRRRADAAGQSLQAYLLASLEEQARRPTISELFDRPGRRTGASLPLDYATRVIRDARDAHAS
jgi:antitoxin FitA